MLELYQFELSHYCEKVRLILDYKGVPYRKIEVTPGIGQLEVFRLSGQRQVPVLKDGSTVIADSTEIAKYLDREYPERPIVPTDPKQRGLCLLMEEWADESIGQNGRKALLGAFSQDASFRTAALPSSVPPILKNLVGAVPGEILGAFNTGLGLGSDTLKLAKDALKQNLEALCLLLANQPYLVADQPTLADFAVAGMTLYLKFPDGPYLNIPENLRGRGVPGLADDSAYTAFFEWRDRLYRDFRIPLTEGTTSGAAPNQIPIE
ncbi:glutathione S-transferase [Leptolyngbya sp. 'hensonii']|uniref:glutathione S-transferase family protein n=1 Tax=Leptolyngbya sp. 'hensonii' TaxID=1922337 RepID=UPI00094F6981|nr:glutathione S-transferase family protein [Leptolyngbya sp. 'hensonii']OLP17615.1 glutathione S-transferase [Leptolyngbya sp. 'hensonii']